MKFSFVRANALKVLLLPAYVLIGLVARVWRRDPERWVFGRKSGFGEGPLRVLMELRRLHPEYRLVWMAQNEPDKAVAEAAGVDSVLRGSLAGFATTLRAGVVVITHGLGDVSRPVVPGAKVVQLWHGTPLKRIGLDAPATYRLGRGVVGRLAGWLMLIPYRAAYHVPSVYVAACKPGAERFRTAFGVPDKRIIVAGDPRCDCLVVDDGETSRRVARQKLATLWNGLALPGRIYLYAPTWRDGEADPGVPQKAEWQAIARLCERVDALLVVRSHPHGYGMDDADLGAGVHERVCFLPAATVNDVTPYLHAVDALITDYSALAMDYALLERPIHFFAPDRIEYERSRGFYESYADFTGGAWSTTWAQVLSAIAATSDDEEVHARHCERSRVLKRRYHEHPDGMAASRVVHFVMSDLLSEGGPK